MDFDSKTTKPVQMTQFLRDLGINNPRMPDIKDAVRVLHEHGIEKRRTNGKNVYDLDYTPVEDSVSGSSGSFGGDYKDWNDD